MIAKGETYTPVERLWNACGTPVERLCIAHGTPLEGLSSAGGARRGKPPSHAGGLKVCSRMASPASSKVCAYLQASGIRKKEKLIIFFFSSPEGLKVCAYLQAPCRRYARACLQGARVVPAGGRAGTKSSKKRVPALARAKFASKSVGQGQSFPKSPRPQRAAIEKSQARPRFWMPVCVFRLTFEKTTFVFLVVSHPIVPRGHGIHGVAPSAFEPSPRNQGSGGPL